MSPKHNKREVVTLPETLSGPLQLFLAVAVADEGHPKNLTYLGGYSIRRGNVIPGVRCVNNQVNLSAFESIFGPQPALRAIRNLLDEAKTNGWDSTKKNFSEKAKSLTFSVDVLRAMIKHGTQRISALASLALFYRTVSILPDALLKLASDVAETTAYSGKFSTTMADVDTVELAHGDGYLTVNQPTLGPIFTNAITTLATADNGAMVYANVRLWPRAAAISDGRV